MADAKYVICVYRNEEDYIEGLIDAAISVLAKPSGLEPEHRDL